MIRYATEEDAEALADLEQRIFPGEALNEHSCKRELFAGRCWIADDQGYVLTRWGPEIIDVLRLGVLPEHQGRGLGRRLLRLVLIHADLPVILTVRRSNEKALALYRSEGFVPVAHVPEENALILQRAHAELRTA